jgi:hypothetical protein
MGRPGLEPGTDASITTIQGYMQHIPKTTDAGVLTRLVDWGDLASFREAAGAS